MRIQALIIVCFFLFSCIHASIKIAITLDDFPLPGQKLFSTSEITDRLIETADCKRCTLAFFCVGDHFQINRSEIVRCLQRIDTAGHYIANHSMSHSFASTIPLEQLEQEIIRVDSLLEPYAHKKKWFRFPYLDYGASTSKGGSREKALAAERIVKSHGYSIAHASVLTMDCRINKELQIALKKNTLINYEALKSLYISLIKTWCIHYIHESQLLFNKEIPHILCLHANDINALFLGDIIDMARQEGWEIISPQEAFENPAIRDIHVLEFTRLYRTSAPFFTIPTITQALIDAGAWSVL